MPPLASQLLQSIISNENTAVEFDLDNWITDFENCFLDYSKTNPLYMPGYWGQGIINRPRIRELNVEADAQSNQGYRVIEFFPDRERKDESYMLFGTPFELRIQVAILMNFGSLLRSSNLGIVYPPPSKVWQSERKFKPQVFLYFKQDVLDLPPKQRPMDGRISFRLMGQESTTISISEAAKIATQIKALFLDEGGHVWEKGKKMCTYTDWAKGYQLQMPCSTETEGKQLATKVLAIQNHIFEPKRFGVNKNEAEEATYPENPGTRIILGETEKIPRKRPNSKVRFRYAVIRLHGRKKPLALCDRANKLINPLA